MPIIEINEKLTRIIRSRSIELVTQEEGAVVIVFDDYSTLPVQLVDKISKMHRVALQMSEELGREPTNDEVAEEIGISNGKVSQLKTVSARPTSLDAPISDDDSAEFGEFVSSRISPWQKCVGR